MAVAQRESKLKVFPEVTRYKEMYADMTKIAHKSLEIRVICQAQLKVQWIINTESRAHQDNNKNRVVNVFGRPRNAGQCAFPCSQQAVKSPREFLYDPPETSGAPNRHAFLSRCGFPWANGTILSDSHI